MSNFVATSTSRIVAVLRIVPQIVSTASDTWECCSASNSSRWETSLRCWASCKNAFEGMGTPLSEAKRNKLQMGCLSAENLKEERKDPQVEHTLFEVVYS